MYVDADSTFTSDTLDQVIPAFESDSQLGYVQMMTVANNIKVNALSRAVGIQQTVQRFVLGEFGNWGIPIFYGHNAIFRRKVIDDLGGFLELDTQGNFMLTEDFSATISTYLNGYYGKTHWMYTSEGVPTSLKALKSMWHRWTFGAWQVLFKQFGKITRSKELTIFERISFFSFGLSYIANAFVPLFILLSFFSPAFFVLPIAIPAFTSLLSIVGFELKFKGLINEASKLERIKIYYQAFFMIPTYIVWVTLQASLEFFIQYFFNKTPSKIRKHLSRSGLEWVVTSKGNEREESFMFILKKHVDVFIFALLSLSIGISCFFRNGIYDNLLIVLPGAFFIANLLGTIVLFGKQGRNEDETMLGKVQAKELENFVKQGAKHTGKTTVEKYQVAEQYS